MSWLGLWREHLRKLLPKQPIWSAAGELIDFLSLSLSEAKLTTHWLCFSAQNLVRAHITRLLRLLSCTRHCRCRQPSFYQTLPTPRTSINHNYYGHNNGVVIRSLSLTEWIDTRRAAPTLHNGRPAGQDMDQAKTGVMITERESKVKLVKR